VEKIKALLKASPFHGEGYRKVWARIRRQGIRTSKRRVLRLMRVHGLLAPHRVGHPHGPTAHDGKITTERINQMWGTDMTSCWTTVEDEGKRLAIRSQCLGTGGKVFQAVGVAIPPTIREL